MKHTYTHYGLRHRRIRSMGLFDLYELKGWNYHIKGWSLHGFTVMRREEDGDRFEWSTYTRETGVKKLNQLYQDSLNV